MILGSTVLSSTFNCFSTIISNFFWWLRLKLWWLLFYSSDETYISYSYFDVELVGVVCFNFAFFSYF